MPSLNTVTRVLPRFPVPSAPISADAFERLADQADAMIARRTTRSISVAQLIALSTSFRIKAALARVGGSS